MYVADLQAYSILCLFLSFKISLKKKTIQLSIYMAKVNFHV